MIYLMGCSYVDETYNSEDYAWPKRIADKYIKVKNLAKHGTGPQYSLSLLRELIKKNAVNSKKDSLIFFIPEYFRMNFRYFKPNEQVWSYANNTAREYFNKTFLDYFDKKHFDWQTQWWYEYQMYQDNDLLDIFKIYTLINYYAKYFKKVLIMTTDGYLNNHLDKHDDPEKMLDSPNITFCKDITVDRISNEEIGTFYEHMKDTRPNHISEYNHDIMFRMLCNWIEYDIKPTYKFKTRPPS